jgi:UDP-N-acetylglucosamine--N-acetylmuramyl-(pentapeptide) pyrophosphoryl-undecaprenol N-acetylglucosamine transferase
LIPARGYPLELIPPVPLPRRISVDLAKVPFRVRTAVVAVEKVLDRVSADAVVGFGGYVALPAYLAARKHRIPIIVHEANARPGVANRFAARLTRHVYTASSAVHLAHAKPIGIPLRPAIADLDRVSTRPGARKRLGLAPDRLTLLVTGGSQGARSLNRAILGAEQAFAAAGIQVLHIAGDKNPIETPDRSPDQAPYVVLPYLETMTEAYAAADFVLCRSGAITCAELTAVGLPAAYVPLPLRGGEQGLNAKPIVAAGGGLSVPDAELTTQWVEQNVIAVMTDDRRLAEMSAAAKSSGARDAGAVLARHILEVVRDRQS